MNSTVKASFFKKVKLFTSLNILIILKIRKILVNCEIGVQN